MMAIFQENIRALVIFALTLFICIFFSSSLTGVVEAAEAKKKDPACTYKTAKEKKEKKKEGKACKKSGKCKNEFCELQGKGGAGDGKGDGGKGEPLAKLPEFPKLPEKPPGEAPPPPPPTTPTANPCTTDGINNAFSAEAGSVADRARDAQGNPCKGTETEKKKAEVPADTKVTTENEPKKPAFKMTITNFTTVIRDVLQGKTNPTAAFEEGATRFNNLQLNPYTLPPNVNQPNNGYANQMQANGFVTPAGGGGVFVGGFNGQQTYGQNFLNTFGNAFWNGLNNIGRLFW